MIILVTSKNTQIIHTLPIYSFIMQSHMIPEQPGLTTVVFSYNPSVIQGLYSDSHGDNRLHCSDA